MSKDQPNIRLGDSNPEPPTPKQTPTSAVFPSPIFQTPNRNPFSHDSSGRTPRFAEDYSVFNSIPGDLRGTQRPFGDLDQDAIKYSHQRVFSAEGLAIEIATHVNHFSPNPDLPLPPVDPARRLASSPKSVNVPKEYSAEPENLLSPNPSKQQQSTKKARRGTVTETEPTQTATPPPTDRRGKRKLAPNLTMQNDQSFVQPDFTGASQQHELAALMAASGDMFGYPMSAPAAASANFWDPSMGMDLDFGPPQPNMFQSTPVSSHRHTGSFDWNSEIPLFQEPSAPHHSNQEGIMPTRRERALAPKLSGPGSLTAAASNAMPAAFAPQMDDPFSMMNPGDAVDPGLLFGRSQSLMDISFNSMAASGSAEAAIAESGSRSSMGGDLRRSASFQDVRHSNVPDRTFASSPVKSSSRAGLNRSMSENRGKRAQGRPSLPKLAPAPAPAPRPTSQASNGSSVESGRPIARPSGRASPLKHQHRLSSLASIPEASPQPPTWRSVRFTIDSRGRARAEATVVVGSTSSNGNISPRRTSRDASRKDDWEASDDDSSTDDEPIIIPSRANSFNASFALPDPRKPVGSIFHSSKRSSSERSLGSFSNDGPGSQHDGDSEAETVMNEAKDKVGDAASELRKLVEDRQKRSTQMGSARGQRFLQTNNLGSFRGDTISPSTLTESSNSTDRHEVRCVCHRNRADEGDGFMVQCESCELWLHGKCINMTRRTLPRVYICAFCANTPNMRGGRLRDTGRGTGTHGSVASPLANKSFRNFR